MPLCPAAGPCQRTPQASQGSAARAAQAGEAEQEQEQRLRSMHPVASLLSYLTKAPLVPEGAPVINALSRQRAAIENVFRACVGLAPDHNMLLEHK